MKVHCTKWPSDHRLSNTMMCGTDIGLSPLSPSLHKGRHKCARIEGVPFNACTLTTVPLCMPVNKWGTVVYA